MTAKNKTPERIGTQGWEQFLANKQEMLYQYELAKKYAESHIVKVTHGHVAEATFRKWLNAFLPKKYAVTSGYIVSQNKDFVGHALPHYDVIIYDQLNSPILWVEENSDYSEGGKTKAIPAEYVKAVFEVKANLTESTSSEAVKKLEELKILLSKKGDDNPNEGRLSFNFFCGTVFFELKKEKEFKKSVLNNLVTTPDLPYYGGIILSGEGRDVNDTGLFKMNIGTEVIKSNVGKKNLSIIMNNPISDTITFVDHFYVNTILIWSQPNFSFFAFDLIALLEGYYKPGHISSNHGVSWLNPTLKKD